MVAQAAWSVGLEMSSVTEWSASRRWGALRDATGMVASGTSCRLEERAAGWRAESQSWNCGCSGPPPGWWGCGMSSREPVVELRVLGPTTRLVGLPNVVPSGYHSSRCFASQMGSEMSGKDGGGGRRGAGGWSRVEAEAVTMVGLDRSLSSVRSMRLPAKRATSLWNAAHGMLKGSGESRFPSLAVTVAAEGREASRWSFVG